MIYLGDPLYTIIDFGPEIKARNPLNLTDTIDNMKLPINCVVAGQQKEPVKMAMGLSGNIGNMRGIFGE